jgi:addiction module HigA family antidote
MSTHIIPASSGLKALCAFEGSAEGVSVHRLSLNRGITGMSNEFIPAEVFAPGEFLADEIEARGWTQIEFAKLIRRPPKVVNEIIAGKKTITTETARELAAALGTSPQYWLNLETAYQLWKTEPSHTTEVISREAKLRERFPVREMARRGWIRNSQNYEVVEKSVFDFYGIANVDEEPCLMAHAARRNYKNSRLIAAGEFERGVVGGIEKNKHEGKKLKAGRGTVGKTPVVAMRERNGGKMKQTPRVLDEVVP